MANLAYRARTLWHNERGQDLIEYALLAAAVAVAIGSMMPQTIEPGISTIFSKVVSCFTRASNG